MRWEGYADGGCWLLRPAASRPAAAPIRRARALAAAAAVLLRAMQCSVPWLLLTGPVGAATAAGVPAAAAAFAF